MHCPCQYQPPICKSYVSVSQPDKVANKQQDNYGNFNVGSTNLSIQQSGHGHQNFGSQRARNQQQAPLVSRSSRDDLTHSTTDPSISVIARTNITDLPTRVQTVESKAPATSASAPVVVTPVVIDLTNDEAANEGITVSQQATKREAKTASSPRQKVDAKFWREGSSFLKHKLNNVGNSNQYFLFASLQQIEPPAKRHKYAATHWTSEEATFKDIMAMSLYFIDATEMLYYRVRWDAVESELTSGNLRLDEQKKLRDELATDQRRLQAELSNKRQDKLDRIEKEQYGLWIDKMKRDRFESKFGMKAIRANREKVKRDNETDLNSQRAQERASKRARTEMPRDIPLSALIEGKAKRKTGGTRTSKDKLSSKDTKTRKTKPKTQEKSTGTTPTQVTAPVTEPNTLPTSALEEGQSQNPSPSPEPFNKPESADFEIITNPSELERTMSTANSLGMPEEALEDATALSESEDDSGWGDELAAELEESLMADEKPEGEEAQHRDEGYASIRGDNDT